MFVLDASTALAWWLPLQADAISDRAFVVSRAERVLVPAVWFFETHRVLLSMLHNRRMTEVVAAQVRIDLLSTQHDVDPEPIEVVLPAIWALARQHGLAFNDAAYLELAQRRGVPLATRDQPLQRAARQMGVPLI